MCTYMFKKKKKKKLIKFKKKYPRCASTKRMYMPHAVTKKKRNKK